MTELARIAPGDEQGIAAYVAIRNAVTPDDPDSLEQVAWQQANYPASGARFLARIDGRPVATAVTGRIWMHEGGYERYWLGIWVLPDVRNGGIGSALLAAASEVARDAGKTGFQTELSEAHESGHRFLARRGFVETDRTKLVRLELAGRLADDPSPPAGIRIVTLANRPDLAASVHRVALETFGDVPTAGEPLSVGTLDEFRARDVDRAGIPHDGFFVALDDATGEAAGFASLLLVPGSPFEAFNDMTAVRRAFRGRGVAQALKRATIAWAIDHGLVAIITGNDETNAPMRAINARLGYRPLPDLVGLQGPLAAGSGILRP
jgi:mycothiol synthase